MNYFYEDEEEESVGPGTQTSDNDDNGGGLGDRIKGKAQEKVKEKAQEEIKKKAQKKVAEEGVKAGAKVGTQAAASSAAAGGTAAAAGGTVAAAGGAATLMTPVGWVILAIVLIIVIIICLSGIFMFFATMPGMIMDKLSGIAKTLGGFFTSLFGFDTTEQIENVEIYETLDYLEEMGYDLKGEGFLTDYYETEADVDAVSDEIKEGVKLDDGYYIDENQGVVRGNNNEVILAESDFIWEYIKSDNYIYTIKNKNIATQSQNTIKKGFLGFLNEVGTAIGTARYKAYNALFGVVYDAFGTTDAMIDTFGSGMLVFYRQNKDADIGVRGSAVNFSSWLDGVSNIEVNPTQQTLTIKRNGFLNGNRPVVYSLDGWTGRYGMPLEFLLSIHKATMKPDLAYDMAKRFQTNVNIILREVAGEVEAGYKTENGIITYTQFNSVYSSLEAKDKSIWGRIVNWFDRLVQSDKETIAMKELGVDVITRRKWLHLCKRRNNFSRWWRL